ncbi:hypothetical protein BFO_0174 [Tannerella forsythia 92A2]|uniref:Uncharacterized protein n=1 Tax=Tannerella forsythia (strain ATCC 43037 / JCM 10827 / CCUG 21028 A / KCTC 5666 / FDC 338) TaxID=203275 RepID=G8UIC1_TANFA|nr:hypothetical protein BFO_0174 [Tannerella forsythia 92A2]
MPIGKTPKGKIKRIYPSGKARKAKSNGLGHRENPEYGIEIKV